MVVASGGDELVVVKGGRGKEGERVVNLVKELGLKDVVVTFVVDFESIGEGK